MILTNALTQSSNEGSFWLGICEISLDNASFGVDDACLPTHDCMVMGSCRLPKFGDAPKGECGIDASQRASDPGLTVAQLASGQPYLVPTKADCSTLEDRAVDGARLQLTIARSNQANEFWSTLPATAAQEDAARHDLIKQAKLMFELGIASPSVPVEALRTLYDTAPGDELSCGVSARPPVSEACRAWGTGHGLDGPLGLCQRLLSSHIAPSVFDAEIARCQDLLARPEVSGTEACAVEYRNVIETLEEQLLAKGFGEIQKPSGASAIAGLETALARIDRWYAAAADAFAADPATLSDPTGRVLKAFWSQVYAVGAPPPSFALGADGTETARTQLADLFSMRIESDRQVLAAAFADPVPLDEQPLLLIASDAMTALGERLRSAAPLYDFACRVKGSCGVAEANEATHLLRLMGAIGDPVALDQALAASAGGAVRAPWHQVFTSIAARREALEVAFRKSTGRSNAALGELYSASVAAPAAGLGELVTRASTMWASYASHGVLQPHDGDVIHTSLVESKVTAALQAFTDRRNDLRAQREAYQRTRGDFARTILDRIANQQYQVRIDGETAVLEAELKNLGGDLDGLMASQDQSEQVIGRFLATYIERARDPDWLPDYPVSGSPVVMQIDATAARGSGGLASDVTAVAVRDPQQPAEPWRLDVQAGDMLSLEVRDLWAPTCALRDTTLVAPSGVLTFASPVDAVTGPEGFAITWNQDQFLAHEHQSSDFSTETDSTSICGSVTAGLRTGPTPVPFGSLAVSGQMCRSWQTGHSETDTTSNGNRFQSSASFAGGMRIPGTPFPSFPGGSLLLVEVVDGPGGPRMRDAHVIRPHSSFLFPGAARLYLVVNDKGGCQAINTSALTVTYTHAHSGETAARALAEAMALVLTSLETRRDTYLAQGSVTAAELSELQTEAYDQLRTSCHCTLGAFPEEVRGMFDAWLTAQLASIERQTRIASVERALDSLVLRLTALQDDLAGAASASRLLALMTTWQLGHLAHSNLRSYAQALLDSSNDAILPMMRILYPQALTTLRTSNGPELDALRRFDWTLPYDEQVNLLESVADAVKARIDTARQAGGQSFAPVMVAFPKPTPAGSPAPVIDGAVIAAPERLAGVWEACATGFCLRRRPVFTIAPEDVYGQALIGLGCGEAAPVVQTFALFAANNGDSGNAAWNTNPRRADVFRGAEVKFPTEEGILGYRMEGASSVLAPPRVRVLAERASVAFSTFDTFVRRDSTEQQGVSPFASFAVELGDVVTNSAFPIAKSTAIIVIFDLQARAALAPLTGLGVCAPGAQSQATELPAPASDAPESREASSLPVAEEP